jgi:ABC-2 type transport system ATP-binding protein
MVPSGDRSFYLRISGLENLMFFARIHGLSRSRASRRAWECLEAVGLEEDGRLRVGQYSHGMQKRLSVARALLMKPPVLLIDEATHDLDPEGARRVRRLVSDAAERGVAVLWATQRVEEVRGFAHRLTLLSKGKVRFEGTVPAFLAASSGSTYLLQLRADGERGAHLLSSARAGLGDRATLHRGDRASDEHFLLSLSDRTSLGEAITALVESGIEVIACRENRAEVEEAFLRLSGDEP